MFPTQGLAYALDRIFNTATLYVGLVTSTGFVSFSDTDTAASHSGWTEYTDYAESTRVEIDFGAASDNTITNPTSITFTPNTSGDVVVGWFLTTVASKSATTGYLIVQSSLLEGSITTQAGIVQSFTLSVSSRNI